MVRHLAMGVDASSSRGPGVVAIDSPPEWALAGRSRPIERQLQASGINVWMRSGFDVWDRCTVGVEGQAVLVLPVPVRPTNRYACDASPGEHPTSVAHP